MSRPDVGPHARPLVSEGRTNEQDAEQLLICVATAKSHLTRVYAKIGLPTGRTGHRQPPALSRPRVHVDAEVAETCSSTARRDSLSP
jgi:DNA-binding NarL/FixJ family response regulator